MNKESMQDYHTKLINFLNKYTEKILIIDFYSEESNIKDIKRLNKDISIIYENLDSATEILAQIHELKYNFKKEEIERLDNLITHLHNILQERNEVANKIKEAFFIHEIPNYHIDIENLKILDNIRKNKASAIEEDLKGKRSNQKNLIHPIDMNLHNNDYSQRLLEGISQNIKEVQINMQTSMKELKDQGQSLKQAHYEVNCADGEMDFADLNINQISSKRRCQIVLMYITAIALFFVIVLLLGFKFLRAYNGF